MIPAGGGCLRLGFRRVSVLFLTERLDSGDERRSLQTGRADPNPLHPSPGICVHLQSDSLQGTDLNFMNLLHRVRTAWLTLLGAALVGCMNPGMAGSLAWETLVRKHTARPGETNIPLTFRLTNAATSGDVIITGVRPSCGCTTARMPPLPWRLTPGSSGQIEANVDIRGKRGVISKVVFVDTTAGTNMLSLVITVPEDRMRNQELALADRQAVFRGECASCHVHPAIGQTGAALYGLACGICHDSEHRATMVPSLDALGKLTDREYWDHWIRHGKAGTLMPAFAQAEGGPLPENQIRSLVDYLVNRPKPVPAPSNPGP